MRLNDVTIGYHLDLTLLPPWVIGVNTGIRFSNQTHQESLEPPDQEDPIS